MATTARRMRDRRIVLGLRIENMVQVPLEWIVGRRITLWGYIGPTVARTVIHRIGLGTVRGVRTLRFIVCTSSQRHYREDARCREQMPAAQNPCRLSAYCLLPVAY